MEVGALSNIAELWHIGALLHTGALLHLGALLHIWCIVAYSVHSCALWGHCPPQRGIAILGGWGVDTSGGGVGTTARPPPARRPVCVSHTDI